MTLTRIHLDSGISLLSAVPAGAAHRQVLLLHGIGGNANSCADLAELLSQQGIAAHAWDAPGYGGSADPDGSVDHPGTVLRVMAELGLDRVDLFGTSWGGVIAAQVASRAPQLVRTVVLADSTRGSGVEAGSAAAMIERVAALASVGSDTFASARAPRLVSPTADQQVRLRVRDEMAKVRLPGYRAAAEFMAGTDNTAVLRELRVPSLVVVGSDDVVTGVPESELLADLVPGARLVVLPGAGHSAVTEQPGEMARALTDFWGALDD